MTRNTPHLTNDQSQPALFFDDGHPDLVGAARSASGSNVRWWRNPGPGGGAWDEHNVSGLYLNQALAVAVGDLDHDGHLDIAAAGSHSSVGGVFMWYRNRVGSGTVFDAYDVSAGHDTPHSVDVADVDDNGTRRRVGPGGGRSGPRRRHRPDGGDAGCRAGLPVAETADGAASATPSCFRPRHRAGGTVTPLRYEIADIDPAPALFFTVEGGLVCVDPLIFADGFESGDSSEWSVAVP